MSKVLVVFSTGFEEIETVTIIDVLRRAQVEVLTASISGNETKGAHQIVLKADKELNEIKDLSNFDMIVLPGGADNTFNLANSELLIETLQQMKEKDKYLAAICAAPYVLDQAKVLESKYTCYPSFEKKIETSKYIDNQAVVQDGKIITSQGPATAMQFALELVKILEGEDTFKQVKEGLLVSCF